MSWLAIRAWPPCDPALTLAALVWRHWSRENDLIEMPGGETIFRCAPAAGMARELCAEHRREISPSRSIWSGFVMTGIRMADARRAVRDRAYHCRSNLRYTRPPWGPDPDSQSEALNAEGGCLRLAAEAHRRPSGFLAKTRGGALSRRVGSCTSAVQSNGR